MASYDFSIVNADVVLPGGEPARVDIGVRDGRIAADPAGGIDADRTLDATGLAVLPGLIDEHFHVFRGYPWETYENATRAAIKGGVTSVVDMPLDNPPTLSAERWRQARRDRGHLPRRLRLLRRLPRRRTRRDGADGPRPARRPSSSSPAARAPRHVPGRRRRAAARRAAPRRGARADDDDPRREPRAWSTSRPRGCRPRAAGPRVWDDARPWFSEMAAAQTRRARGAGGRRAGGHRARQRARRRSSRCTTRGAAARTSGRRRVTTTCARPARRARATCAEVEPADPQRGRRRPAVGAGAATGASTRSAATTRRCPRPTTPTCGRCRRGPATGRRSCSRCSRRRRCTSATSRSSGSPSSCPRRRPALRPRPAQGRHPDRRRRGLRIAETDGRKVLDADDLEYHEQERWSPFDGAELRVYPVYTVLGGRVVFAEGEVLGAPGDGAFLG